MASRSASSTSTATEPQDQVDREHHPAGSLVRTAWARCAPGLDVRRADRDGVRSSNRETIGPATLRSLRRGTRPVAHGTTRVVPHQATAEPAAGSRVPCARTHNRGTAPDPVLYGDPLAIVECYD